MGRSKSLLHQQCFPRCRVTLADYQCVDLWPAKKCRRIMNMDYFLKSHLAVAEEDIW